MPVAPRHRRSSPRPHALAVARGPLLRAAAQARLHARHTPPPRAPLRPRRALPSPHRRPPEDLCRLRAQRPRPRVSRPPLQRPPARSAQHIFYASCSLRPPTGLRIPNPSFSFLVTSIGIGGAGSPNTKGGSESVGWGSSPATPQSEAAQAPCRAPPVPQEPAGRRGAPPTARAPPPRRPPTRPRRACARPLRSPWAARADGMAQRAAPGVGAPVPWPPPSAAATPAAPQSATRGAVARRGVSARPRGERPGARVPERDVSV
jgi:hypothetical protein